MKIFYVTGDIELRVKRRKGVMRHFAELQVVRLDGVQASNGSHHIGNDEDSFLLQSPRDGILTSDNCYVASHVEVSAINHALRTASANVTLCTLGPTAVDQVSRRWRIPRRLGHVSRSKDAFTPLEARLAGIDPSRRLRLAILNAFASAYGDSVLFLTVLRELRAKLQGYFADVHTTVFQLMFNIDTDSLYRQSSLVAEVGRLPVPLSTWASYDAYIDLSAEHLRSDVAWIDGCLEAVGIAPHAVPAERKRNRLELDPAANALLDRIVGLRAWCGPVLLFHPFASTSIRSMPNDAARRHLTELLDRTDFTIVSAVKSHFSHERFIDCSHLLTSFAHFVGLISQVDMFVSVDTATYHVADAFDVPGVVLFTSIHPAFRIAYYPYVVGLHLDVDDRLSGMHHSDRPEDIEYARSLWNHLDSERVVDGLLSTLRRRANAERGNQGRYRELLNRWVGSEQAQGVCGT